MATQLVAPNLDPVIYQNGKILYNWMGYCLAYAQTAFSAPWAGNSAWEAWEKCKYSHPDKLFPKNGFFLVWFSHWGTYGYPAKYGNWGHVAIMDGATGKIYSSPDDNKSTFDVFNSMAEIESALRCTFQGWSEDIGGLRVIQVTQGGEMITDADVDVLRIGHSEIGGWSYGDTHLGKNDKLYLGAWKGQDARTFVRAQFHTATAQAFREAREANAAFVAKWSGLVGELSSNPTKAELKAVQDALAVERAKVTETEAKLAEELAKPPEVVKEVVYQNVSAPLTWKTVLPWIIGQFKGIKK